MGISFFGVCGFLAGLFIFVESWLLRKNGIEVTATVTWIEKKRDSEGGYSYCPILQYEVGGERFEERYRTSDPVPQYQIGEKLLIYCDPKKPQKILVKNDTTRRGVSIMFIIIGLFYIVWPIFGNPSWS